MYPRFLITLDEELNNIPVTVRVGQVSIRIWSTTRGLSPSYLGRRCCRPSWQTENDIWIPNTSNTCPVGYDRKIGACYRGIYSFRTCSRGLCHLAEKSRMGERRQDGAITAYVGDRNDCRRFSRRLDTSLKNFHPTDARPQPSQFINDVTADWYSSIELFI
jgi:hypothetical protein